MVLLISVPHSIAMTIPTSPVPGTVTCASWSGDQFIRSEKKKGSFALRSQTTLAVSHVSSNGVQSGPSRVNGIAPCEVIKCRWTELPGFCSTLQDAHCIKPFNYFARFFFFRHGYWVKDTPGGRFKWWRFLTRGNSIRSCRAAIAFYTWCSPLGAAALIMSFSRAQNCVNREVVLSSRRASCWGIYLLQIVLNSCLRVRRRRNEGPLLWDPTGLLRSHRSQN